MLDNVISSVTGFLKNYALGFIIAGAVGTTLLNLIYTGSFDVAETIQVVVTALVAGITTSAVIGGVNSL